MCKAIQKNLVLLDKAQRTSASTLKAGLRLSSRSTSSLHLMKVYLKDIGHSYISMMFLRSTFVSYSITPTYIHIKCYLIDVLLSKTRNFINMLIRRIAIISHFFKEAVLCLVTFIM